MEPATAGILGALFVTGLASSVHCIAMCGGIVAAVATTRRVIPIQPRRDAARLIALNAGRLATYAALGAAGGTIASALAAQVPLYVLANVMLLLAGLYLAGVTAPLARLEALAAPLWRRIQPLASRALAAGGALPLLGAGLAWGLLPCGLVYAALAVAVLAGGPAAGALAMLAFGAGTLPALLAAGLVAARLRAGFARRGVRLAAGALLLGFGGWGLAHAAAAAQTVRRAILCL
jgi:hypothetical protein